MYDAETINRVNQLRMKESAGTLTLDDLKEAVKLIRAGRLQAQAASTASKTRTTKSKLTKTGDQLLDELDNI